MNVRSFLCFAAVTFIGITRLFSQSVIVNSTTLAYPTDQQPDSLLKVELVNSLNSFLSRKEGANKDNGFVSKAHVLETWLLLDEMKGMEKNARLKDDNFYKCYLTDVVKIDNVNFMVQLSYMGIVDGKPYLNASFKLQAKMEEGHFCFYSPLKYNTTNWKTRKIGNMACYFKDTINMGDAKAYLKTVTYYDGKLKAPTGTIDLYYCDNFMEVMQLLGVEYKAAYHGILNSGVSIHQSTSSLIINGEAPEHHRFDPHDLWHDRLHAVLSTDIINRPVDEGTAYLYGGSWGLTWDEVLTKFKIYAADNPNADWLALYIAGTNFSPGPKILKISYALNALIARKLEKEKGFGAVMELLSCGKKETGDGNYFTALYKVSGISKENFNKEMWKLISDK